MADLYAVKNTGKNIITISGHNGIHPGEVEVLDEDRKDTYADHFPDETEITEYTPEGDEPDEEFSFSKGDDPAQYTGDGYENLKDWVRGSEDKEELNRLLTREQEGKDRTTLQDVISDRLDELSEGE